VTQLVKAWLSSPVVGSLDLSTPAADDPTLGVIADLRRRLRGLRTTTTTTSSTRDGTPLSATRTWPS
jgi:hypothetical protein